jgi:hypothetical protein
MLGINHVGNVLSLYCHFVLVACIINAIDIKLHVYIDPLGAQIINYLPLC